MIINAGHYHIYVVTGKRMGVVRTKWLSPGEIVLFLQEHKKYAIANRWSAMGETAIVMTSEGVRIAWIRKNARNDTR
jgi:hypothetical protein